MRAQKKLTTFGQADRDLMKASDPSCSPWGDMWCSSLARTESKGTKQKWKQEREYVCVFVCESPRGPYKTEGGWTPWNWRIDEKNCWCYVWISAINPWHDRLCGVSAEAPMDLFWRVSLQLDCLPQLLILLDGTTNMMSQQTFFWCTFVPFHDNIVSHNHLFSYKDIYFCTLSQTNVIEQRLLPPFWQCFDWRASCKPGRELAYEACDWTAIWGYYLWQIVVFFFFW